MHLALVRVHASKSDLFDRHGEIATFRAVSSAGVGPKLLLLFGNGRIEEFLGDHITLSAEDMKQPGVAAAIAKAMAAFHFELASAAAGAPCVAAGFIYASRLNACDPPRVATGCRAASSTLLYIRRALF